MSAISPDNFKPAKQIAREILDAKISSDDSSFEQIIKDCYASQATPETHDENNGLYVAQCAECKELLDNLAAIAQGKTTALALGASALKLIDAIISDRKSIAASHQNDIHPESKGNDIELLLRDIAAEKKGKPKATIDDHEVTNARNLESFQSEKKLIKALEDKIKPALNDLLNALDREKAGGRGAA